MGLDMYLRAEQYISRYDYKKDFEKEENEIFAEIVRKFNMEDVIAKDSFAGLTIDFPMGYWRKANQIHQWFVDNVGDGVDDCQKMFVPLDRLEELKDVVISVLAQPEKAEELLPVGEGFFFGSYEYDEWYFETLKETLEILTRCIESGFEYFEYQASW